MRGRAGSYDITTSAGHSCVKNIGVFDSPGPVASLASPGQHRQYHLHHPHQRPPRMWMQVILGMLPMLENLEMKEMHGHE